MTGDIVQAKVSRRHVNRLLMSTALGAALSPLGTAEVSKTLDPSTRKTLEHGNPLAQFRYSDIEFAPCRQKAQLEQTHSVLMGMNEDSLLRPFRTAAGLPA